MMIMEIPSARPFARKASLAALACILALAVSGPESLAGTDSSSLERRDDMAPALPLAVTFDKVTDAEAGPYVAKLKNTSSDSLTVSGTYYPSVGIHSDLKEKKLAETTIAPGGTWSIPGLAATDKLKIVGKGFADLDITVP
jgi:hypothetical protein